MKVISALCVSLCSAEVPSHEACAEPIAGSSMVQQSFGELRKMDVGRSDERRTRYESYVARPAMEYYKDWSHGSISHQMENLDIPLELLSTKVSRSVRTEDRAIKLMHDYMLNNCAGQEEKSNLKLHDASTDDAGVHHVVLASPGQVQYLAFLGKYMMHADPPLCQSESESLMQLPEDKKKGITEGGKGGTRKQLSLEDKYVTDCKELFHKTVKKNCEADMNITVKSAREQLLDGIGVEMYVKVSKDGKSKHHSILCDFEVPSDHTDSSLLQLFDSSDPNIAGLEATLVLSEDVKLCELNEQTGVTLAEEEALNLMEELQFGELSLFKGYEYLSEVLPRIGDDEQLSLVEAPESSDLRTRYPSCFPKKTEEVVRNQGQCGSCWAFAVASTVMNELCVSGKGANALISPEDRAEVSVSQIMACNPANRGCNGGHAVAGNAALQQGVYAERVSPYMCGSKPVNGVDRQSSKCKAAPWGPACLKGEKKEVNWNYAGASAVSGETKMKDLVAAGHSLYATMNVFPNFMNLKEGNGVQDGVYNKNVGKQLSGHAVVIVAYGVTDSKIKYWVLQNSWGHDWAEHGYGKFLRGENLAEIEDLAYYMRAWVKGGSIPPCYDGTSSGMKKMNMKTEKPEHISCAAATDPNGFFGNTCIDKEFGAEVSASCPVTCGACKGGMGSAEDWGTGKATPPGKTPAAKNSAPATTQAAREEIPAGPGSDSGSDSNSR